MAEVPSVLRPFGSTPVSAVQGCVRSELSRFKSAVRRAASRLGITEEKRKVGGETWTVSYTDDTKDGVNETAAKLLMLLQKNPVAVGDELLRTWKGQSQGEWKADRQSTWSAYVLDHPALNSVRYNDGARSGFEPITMTIVAGALLALAPVVLPVILEMVQDFFKSEQDKAKDEREATAKAEETKAAQESEKTQMVFYAVGGVIALAAVGGVIYYFARPGKKAAA